MRADIRLTNEHVEVIGNAHFIANEGDTSAARIEAFHANMVLGGSLRNGTIILEDATGEPKLGMYGEFGNIHAGNIFIDGDQGDLTLGSNKRDGDLIVKNANNENTMLVDGKLGKVRLGKKQAIVLNGTSGEATFGTNQVAGSVEVTNNMGHTTCSLQGNTGQLSIGESALFFVDGANGLIRCGNNTAHGVLHLHNQDNKRTVDLNGRTGSLRLGAAMVNGEITLSNRQNRSSIQLNADHASVICGSDERDGLMEVTSTNGLKMATVKPGHIQIIENVPAPSGTFGKESLSTSKEKGDGVNLIDPQEVEGLLETNKRIDLKDGEVIITKNGREYRLLKLIHQLQGRITALEDRH